MNKSLFTGIGCLMLIITLPSAAITPEKEIIFGGKVTVGTCPVYAEQPHIDLGVISVSLAKERKMAPLLIKDFNILADFCEIIDSKRLYISYSGSISNLKSYFDRVLVNQKKDSAAKGLGLIIRHDNNMSFLPGDKHNVIFSDDKLKKYKVPLSAVLVKINNDPVIPGEFETTAIFTLHYQ